MNAENRFYQTKGLGMKEAVGALIYDFLEV